MKTIFKNAKVITPFRLIEHGGISVENGKIIDIFQGEPADISQDYQVIDVKGNYLSPGFIDIHSHGGGKHDFMDGSVQAILQGCKTHMKYGTTTMVPTTVTSTVEELYKTLDNIKTAKKNNAGVPNILGLHLEGPYISMEQRGAQDPKFIKNPDKEEYLEILSKTDEIIRWTIAPELEGAFELGIELKKRGIVASIGHSNAVYEQVLKAFEHGYTHVTHLYSGMSIVRRINAYRYAGVVESAFLINDMTVEIIADGKHLPASLLKLIYNIKGPEKICLITDSMRAAGTSDSESILGSLSNGQRVLIEDGVAKLMDRASFAGSVATADRLVRTMIKIAQVPLLDAVKMMTYTPAKVMGIEKTKGTLAVGKDADIIVFDDNINVSLVMINGEIRINEIL